MHGESGAALTGAIAWLLRPLIRLMIARGILLPAAVALLKKVYVEVAAEHFALPDKPLTDSRISLITGVHRRDVRSLREAGAPSTVPPQAAISATAIGRWLGDPRFRDEAGKPLPLARGADSGVLSFDELLDGVIKDVRPRTVLDDLLARGLVVGNATGDRFELRAGAFVPGDDETGLAAFLGANLHDHLAVATRNLLEPATPGLERAVYYNRLTVRSVETIRAAAEDQAMALLHAVNEQALALQQADAEAADNTAAVNTRRFRFGVYFYAGPDSEQPPAKQVGAGEPDKIGGAT